MFESFKTTLVPARKDLIDLIREEADRYVLRKLGKDPERWIDELNMLYQMLTGQNLVAGIGLFEPPEQDPAFRWIGKNTYYYSGRETRPRGIWREAEIRGFEGEVLKQWTHYALGGKATVGIHPDFTDLPAETFLPEIFERESNLKRRNLRSIHTFKIRHEDRTQTVYAKGTTLFTWRYYKPPSYRLTDISGLRKNSSIDEGKRFMDLERLGVHVPQIIAYYQSPVEDWLFVLEVEGKNPQEFFTTHRDRLLQQDAHILAALCRLGLRKQGFCDFDDKLFNEQHLYLIDADECLDLYDLCPLDFRRALQDPTDDVALRHARRVQRAVFLQCARDAAFTYRSTLTPTRAAREQYLDAFCEQLGWRLPNREKSKLLTFDSNYVTLERSLAMMAED